MAHDHGQRVDEQLNRTEQEFHEKDDLHQSFENERLCGLQRPFSAEFPINGALATTNGRPYGFTGERCRVF